MYGQSPRYLERSFLIARRDSLERARTGVQTITLGGVQAAQWSGPARQNFDARVADLRSLLDEAGAAIQTAVNIVEGALYAVDDLIVTERVSCGG